MCGIAGAISLRGERIEAEVAARMGAQLTHRGPDAHGAVSSGPVAFAHTRLSIVDLSGGVQPMAIRDGSLLVTFNGEIYNHVELRQELASLGHRFETRSDTEAILHAYAEWGDECVTHFNGQWAFALYDARQDRVLLSRDPMGIRPLYVTGVPGALLFASEVKALLAHPQVSRGFDHGALAEALCFWSPLGPHTVFAGIDELAPGHSMVVTGPEKTTSQYHCLDFDDVAVSEAEAIATTRELLIDSTRLRLRADVPVGAYLSGGLDSTITTAIVRHFSNAPLRTYSVAFDSDEHDESSFQRLASKHLGTDHHELRIAGSDIARVFPDVIRHAERPLFRTAPAPLFLLSQAVRDDGFKVVLTGEGADEVFGGYDLFKEAKIRRFIARQPGSVRRPTLLRRLYPWMQDIQKQSPAYLQKFFHARAEDLALPYFSHLPRWDLGHRLELFLSDEARAQMGQRDLYREATARLPGRFESWDAFSQAQYLEARMLLPGYILSAQGDRMAMSHSVEGRFPFLDPRVVTLGASLPARLKMKGLDEKYILKRAFADLLPEAITARKKQPYRAPDTASFVSGPEGSGAEPDYLERMFDEDRLAQFGVFHPGKARRLLKKARDKGLPAVRDNMAFVTILSTQLLIEQLIDSFVAAPARTTSPPVETAHV